MVRAVCRAGGRAMRMLTFINSTSEMAILCSQCSTDTVVNRLPFFVKNIWFNTCSLMKRTRQGIMNRHCKRRLWNSIGSFWATRGRKWWRASSFRWSKLFGDPRLNWRQSKRGNARPFHLMLGAPPASAWLQLTGTFTARTPGTLALSWLAKMGKWRSWATTTNRTIRRKWRAYEQLAASSTTAGFRVSSLCPGPSATGSTRTPRSLNKSKRRPKNYLRKVIHHRRSRRVRIEILSKAKSIKCLRFRTLKKYR